MIILNQLTIKERIQLLSQGDRRQLMHSFDEEIPEYIKLEDGYFLGVHVEHLPTLEVLEQAGAWSYGRIK